jgi:hypothetical protein
MRGCKRDSSATLSRQSQTHLTQTWRQARTLRPLYLIAPENQFIFAGGFRALTGFCQAEGVCCFGACAAGLRPPGSQFHAAIKAMDSPGPFPHSALYPLLTVPYRCLTIPLIPFHSGFRFTLTSIEPALILCLSVFYPSPSPV